MRVGRWSSKSSESSARQSSVNVGNSEAATSLSFSSAMCQQSRSVLLSMSCNQHDHFEDCHACSRK